MKQASCPRDLFITSIGSRDLGGGSWKLDLDMVKDEKDAWGNTVPEVGEDPARYPTLTPFAMNRLYAIEKSLLRNSL